jgi:6,7-dimethyl-8-ribityllumazine synthase
MPRTYEGNLDAGGLRFGIVVSRYNELLTGRLLDGAIDCLTRHGAHDDDLVLIKVPGAWELPMAVARLAASRKVDAIIALGVVIRGATPHFEYIAAEVTKGIAQVQLEVGIPISYGVLTPDTIEQAIERAGTKSGNKGFDAAMAAIEMANLFRQLAAEGKRRGK